MVLWLTGILQEPVGMTSVTRGHRHTPCWSNVRRNCPQLRPGGPAVPKFVYNFAEGNKDLKDLLGGKGANLAEMTRMGLPVPPGFVITTEACRTYMREGSAPAGMDAEISEHLIALEEAMGRKLGQPDNPLLVSVRSGGKFSMPGMMDTVLNVGLNDQSVLGFAKQSGNERLAFDSYRRLIQMFGKTVLGVDGKLFEAALHAAKDAKDTRNALDLDAEDCLLYTSDAADEEDSVDL